MMFVSLYSNGTTSSPCDKLNTVASDMLICLQRVKTAQPVQRKPHEKIRPHHFSAAVPSIMLCLNCSFRFHAWASSLSAWFDVQYRALRHVPALIKTTQWIR